MGDEEEVIRHSQPLIHAQASFASGRRRTQPVVQPLGLAADVTTPVPITQQRPRPARHREDDDDHANTKDHDRVRYDWK
jgi:hypothetical protein